MPNSALYIIPQCDATHALDYWFYIFVQFPIEYEETKVTLLSASLTQCQLSSLVRFFFFLSKRFRLITERLT